MKKGNKIMKKIIILIFIAICLIGCNEVKTEVTVQTEEVHIELYKKIKYYKCLNQLFDDLHKVNVGFIKFFEKTDTLKMNFDIVAEEIFNTKDTLALFYACDNLAK